PPAAGARAAAKIRYKARPVACTLTPALGDTTRVMVLLDEPLRDVTPGQSAVFYVGDEGDVVLGTAIIAREPALEPA
ncbi:MAG: aminomethyltransferase beta-barrel domain-containing protein, partial [Caldilineaceae bacterium]